MVNLKKKKKEGKEEVRGNKEKAYGKMKVQNTGAPGWLSH